MICVLFFIVGCDIFYILLLFPFFGFLGQGYIVIYMFPQFISFNLLTLLLLGFGCFVYLRTCNALMFPPANSTLLTLDHPG